MLSGFLDKFYNDPIWFVFYLAIILFVTKLFGLLMKKLGLPQVIGFLIGGLLVGPAVLGIVAPYGPNGEQGFVFDGLQAISTLGVLMIMFSAGLETDLSEIKRSGGKAFLIAAAGVVIPLGLGFLVAMGIDGIDGPKLYEAIFIGIVLTATSVGITVETLKEMGKLKGKVGTTILSAAIIDDILGIILLTIAISIGGGEGGGEGISQWIFGDIGVGGVILNTILFFGVAIGIGILVHKLFKWLAKKYPKNRRVPIFSLVFCFGMSFMAEQVFGVADITGAYLAGIILSSLKTSNYVERRIDISSYLIFTPVFFAFIGIKTSFDGFTGSVLLLAFAIICVGIIGKVFGCGLMAKCCKFNNRDSLKVGVGMMARGEVALIVIEKGIAGGIITGDFVPAGMLLVLVTSLLAPILLKILYKKKSANDTDPSDTVETEMTNSETYDYGEEFGVPLAIDNNNLTNRVSSNVNERDFPKQE